MNYTDVWFPEAEDDLLGLWNAASDSGAIAHAATEMQRILAHDPLNSGESRDGGRRVLFVAPLAVRFIVAPQDMLVTVTAVWSIQRKHP